MTTIAHTKTHRALLNKLARMVESIEMGELDSPGGNCSPEGLILLLSEAATALKEQEKKIKSLRLKAAQHGGKEE